MLLEYCQGEILLFLSVMAECFNCSSIIWLRNFIYSPVYHLFRLVNNQRETYYNWEGKMAPYSK
ncbi:hypothetical protein CLOBOL_03479 [Enterocloster bolteae ATCC BAA-613]|uniref:Uncharacterized protein n=1 Tax=Enterocloster bolteae (strain ATCC BAA-613 / DSM 15670 / CCUG 46953 / JCM 12243 / WAL 16351) TaxID=411902 RepID=A8RSY0_ENTBW|nr:hypothetical protein CLOBOL_03479 [Enterocloster bolteae ATCC BAA-613]